MSTSNPAAISVNLPRTLYVSGCAIEGEVELDFRQLAQDSIQEVHVKLRGNAKTIIVRDKTTVKEDIDLVRDDAVLWSQGSCYPAPDEHILRVPFRLQLPPDLPPSFQYGGFMKAGRASVRYSVTAVGVRPGALQLNRRVRIPLALVPKDENAHRARAKFTALAAGDEGKWRTDSKEEKIRRGLWGDYATVQVQLSIPDSPNLPLFVPIPFVIKVKSISAPLTRAKAEAHPPDKPVFPPVPDAYGKLEFKLVRKVFFRARIFTEKHTVDVVVFSRDIAAAVDADVPDREWVPLEDGGEKTDGDPEAKGTWVQRATFRSTFRLDCTPSFALDIIKCEYRLAVKVPFPGLGNDVQLNMPVTVTSGIDTPVVRDDPGTQEPGMNPGLLDLPPAYWDADDGGWRDDEKD
ncbi:hypothetical protein C8Q78DRAFT_985738 [Trametes maxima]|nr:hypothetical protein C8Q78DRAFT_985738 [Trametes maxima]